MNRLKTAILLLGFNYTFMSNLLFPALPGIQKTYGISATQLSLLASLPALVNFLFQPLAGRISDRANRSMVILICLGAYAAGGGFMAVTLLVGASYAFLLLGRSIMGLGELGAFPQYLALIREKLEPGLRQTMMGKMELFTSLGGATAPFVGGYLAGISIGLPFFGSILAAFGTGLIYYLTVRKDIKPSHFDKSNQPVDGKTIQAKTDQSWTFHHSFLGGFMVLGTLVVCQTFIGVYVEQAYGFISREIGLILTIVPLTMALGSMIMIRFGGERIRNVDLVRIGLMGLLGVLILARGGRPWTVFMGLTFIGTTLGFWLPTMDHDVAEAGESNTSGKRLSFFQQSKSLGILVLPPLVGLVIDQLGSYSIAFLLLGGFCFIAGAITLIARKRDILV